MSIEMHIQACKFAGFNCSWCREANVCCWS